MKSIILSLALLCTLCSCASRGFELSQQMPGYDNNLQAVDPVRGYAVDSQGNIGALPTRVSEAGNEVGNGMGSEVASQGANPASSRTLASTENFSLSTMDRQYGAYFIGKSSAVKKNYIVKIPVSKSESESEKVLH